ncbi:DRS1 [Sanghuangporus baumii]
MALDDLVMTIDSDVEEVTREPQKSAKAKGEAKESNKTVVVDDGAPDEKDTLNPEFAFDLTGDVYDEVLNGDDGLGDLVKGSKREPVSVEDIIARRKLSNAAKKRKRDADVEETDEEVDDEDEDILSEEDLSGSEAEDKGLIDDEAEESEDPLATTDEEGDDSDEVLEGGTDDEGEESEDESSESDNEEETQAEKKRKAAFFASPDDPSTLDKTTHTTFTTMSLSRPLLKALTALGFTTPTPIQAATIPVALLGKDVVGNAVTGSGKTAAFMIPVLERLMYRERGKNKVAVRCVVLVPTRELGVQCTDVARKLAAYMDVRISLIVGGLSLKAQEAELRTRPDILVATPGRLIDHLRNSPSFGLETLDVLILDEADRMLSEGFADELKEIIQACPTSRQTMLFSATMTDDVDELVRMSLNRPVKLFVDPKRSTARGLVQEFVRVRSGKESERPALLVALCKRTFKQGVLVFFRSKKLAHQMRVVFGILGMKAEELHGDLSQEQRLRALQLFRDSSVDYLMATDLASRGLDIKGIETVVNYDMPGQLAQYLHRVGRTARAGKKGRSVTLVGEADRKILKAAIKHASDADKVRHRTIPTDQLALWSERLVDIRDEITEVLKEEKEEKAMRHAERDLKKGVNLIEHEKEIFSRPARTWFQSEKEKLAAKETSKKQYELASGVAVPSKERAKEAVDTKGPKRDKFAGLSRRAKRRKLALQEDAGETASVRAAVRNAKKSSRPTKIGLPESRKQKPGKAKSAEKKKRKVGRVTGKQGVFEREMGEKRKSHVSEGVRSSKADRIGAIGRKGSKNKAKVKGKR